MNLPAKYAEGPACPVCLLSLAEKRLARVVVGRLYVVMSCSLCGWGARLKKEVYRLTYGEVK